MPSRQRLLGAALSAFLLVATLVGLSGPAQAADDEPHIYGYVTGKTRADKKHKATTVAASTMTVRLFRSDADDTGWTYLREVKVKSSGIYDVATDGAGRYHLQLVDSRPSYDVDSWARIPDVPVDVTADGAVKNVTARIGGALYGTIKAAGKKAPASLVRAISDTGQIYEVVTDRQGKYALGGLPLDNYRVYAYDGKKRRVGASKLVRAVTSLSFRGASFNLKTRPSAYRGFLRLGGRLATKAVTVTAVNNRTHEYWVQTIEGGALSLRGLTAGSYTLTVPDTGGYFGTTAQLAAVKAGQTRSVDVNLSTRAGTFTGTVVDATSGNPIPNVSIRLKDAKGVTQQELTASAAGTFTIGGTLRAQTGVTIEIFAYDKIGEYFYDARTFSGLSIVDNQTLDLNTISGDTTTGGAKVIKLARTPSTPAPVTPTPTTRLPTTTVPGVTTSDVPSADVSASTMPSGS
jgi:hypothetical protein